MKDVHMKNDDSIFLVLNPNLENDWNYNSEERLLEIKGYESFNPGLRIKTLKALPICLTLFEFDYLVRTNMSTVINMKLLKEKLSYLEGKSVYGGHVWNLKWEDSYSGISKEILKKYYNMQYVSGTSIILSRDNCVFLINNQHLLEDNIVDDVAIGSILSHKQLPNLFLNFQSGPLKDDNVVFFRFKNENDRKNDFFRMIKQYEIIQTLNEEQCA
jgi:hypothetical protein